MNLPNTLTLSRIAVAPLIALLPFAARWELRLAGFVLFIVAAVTDYWDGRLARETNTITNLGKLLDPLADKLLLAATLIPIYLMMRHPEWRFVTPWGTVGTPWWVLAIVLGREAVMTALRQWAASRGTIIAASNAAKWKTGFQSTWVGASYFWFAAAAAAIAYGWTDSTRWSYFAWFNALVGVVTMVAAVILTVITLAGYIRGWKR